MHIAKILEVVRDTGDSREDISVDHYNFHQFSKNTGHGYFWRWNINNELVTISLKNYKTCIVK